MGPEESDNELSGGMTPDEDPAEGIGVDAAPRQFVDRFGNVWTEQWLPDLAYRQMIRRLNRL